MIIRWIMSIINWYFDECIYQNRLVLLKWPHVCPTPTIGHYSKWFWSYRKILWVAHYYFLRAFFPASRQIRAIVIGSQLKGVSDLQKSLYSHFTDKLFGQRILRMKGDKIQLHQCRVKKLELEIYNSQGIMQFGKTWPEEKNCNVYIYKTVSWLTFNRN